MKTIHVHADEGIADRIISFLKSLPPHKVKVEVEEKKPRRKRFNAIELETRSFRFDREEAHER